MTEDYSRCRQLVWQSVPTEAVFVWQQSPRHAPITVYATWITRATWDRRAIADRESALPVHVTTLN